MVLKDNVNGARGESNESRGIPVASMVESIVGCKWSVRLLQLCAEGHARPSAFLRVCPGLSPKVLNERLRKMMAFGILRRTVFGEKPPVQVEYVLTPFGRRFLRILDEVRRLQEAVDTGAIAERGRMRRRAPQRSRRRTATVDGLGRRWRP